MRLYQQGDSGEAVRDIQDRLSALGRDCRADESGTFGPATTAAVVDFQSSKGLRPDGVVGPETWRTLYEAGYRLGDRLLFLRRPMFRGEDVAELQSRLNSLGFDAGKIDGIFGAATERAVLDFEANRGLPEDGKAGPEVLTELRLVARGRISQGRQAVREREWMRTLPDTVVGTRVFFDAACRNQAEAAAAWEAAGAAALELQMRGGTPLMSRAADSLFPERVRAARANRMGAEVVISFQLAEPEEEATFYFQSERGWSEAGLRLAEMIGAAVGGEVAGRATSILRETRAPAVIVASADLSDETGRKAVAGLEQFFADTVAGSAHQATEDPLQLLERPVAEMQ
jgi:N-acetylmuramoyl-L-alanine amidase